MRGRERLIERYRTGPSIGTHCLTGLQVFPYKVLQLMSRSAPVTCLEYGRHARVPSHHPNDPQLRHPNVKEGDKKCHSQQSDFPTKSYVPLMMFSVKLALKCDIPNAPPIFNHCSWRAVSFLRDQPISLGSCECSGQRELVRIFKSVRSC